MMIDVKQLDINTTKKNVAQLKLTYKKKITATVEFCRAKIRNMLRINTTKDEH